MKNVVKPLAQSVSMQLGTIRINSSSISNKSISNQKKVFELGLTKFMISDEEMDDIMKIIKYLHKSGLLIKGVSKAIKNEVRKNKRADVLACYKVY